MNAIRIPNSWNPRGDQMPLWTYLEGGGTRAVEVAHRRWGKDDVSLHWTAVSAHQKIGSYLHMLPAANQAKKAIWDAVNPRTGIRRIDEAFPIGVRESTRENDMFIRFKSGSTWQVVGSDNFHGLIGSSVVGVVFSEWSLADPEAWSQLRPILRENGGWAIFIYTPKGKNHGLTTLELAQKEPGWFHELNPITKTQLLTADAIAAELREYKSEYGEDDGQSYFDQEYNCSFDAPLMGSYYGTYLTRAELEGRITDVPYDPSLPVYTGWDLGRSDDTTIWFAQRSGANVRVIDYYENRGQLMGHYAKVLQDKPYVYKNHFLPHDAKNKVQHAPHSLEEQLNLAGVKNTVVLANTLIDHGISAARQTIPISVFDKTKCEAGLNALRSYHREWDDKKKMYRDEPYHNWASHPADGWRTLCLGMPTNVIKLKQRDAYDDEPRRTGSWMTA